MAAPASREPIPLVERPGDRWLIALCLLFASTSLFVDRLAALDADFCADAHLWGSLCWYGQTFDPLFLANPQWLRVMSGISAWVFGPVYLLMAWGIRAGNEAVRALALPWSVAMLYSMAVHVHMELFGPLAPPHPLVLALIYLPYALAPVLVIRRFWRPHPFTRAVDLG